VNLVGIFDRSKFKIPDSFQKRREKQNKNGNFTQHRISTKLAFGVTLKQLTNYRRYMQCSQNVQLTFFIHHTFSKYFDSFLAVYGHFQIYV